MRFVRRGGRGHLAKRGDVIEHPERAAMRGHNQVIVLYREVVNGCSGQIEFQRLPVRTIVEGNVDAVFRAGIEQAFALWIFADSVDITVVGHAGDDFRPGLAVVGCFENVRAKVIELVAIDGDVGGACRVWRGFDDADEAPFPKFFRSDVCPVIAAVARDVHEPVVAAGPDEAFLDGRFGDRKNRVVILDAGVVLRKRAAGGLLLGFVVARQVAADRSPGHSAVGGLKHRFPAVINDLGIVRRACDRSGPLEAMLQIGSAGAHRIERPGR